MPTLHWFDGTNPLIMHVGFRWDEPARVKNWNCDNDKFQYPSSCRLYGKRHQIYRKVRWKETVFPLYEDKIIKSDVAAFWRKKGWQFPDVSNCRFCFHHRDFQQQYQARLEPENLQWWIDQEDAMGKKFGKRPLKEIVESPLLSLVDDSVSCFCTE